MNPLLILLLRWTALLGVGWVLQWLLRSRHARWRVILWRGMLCACIAAPLMPFVPAPVIRIPILSHATVSEDNLMAQVSHGTAVNPSPQAPSIVAAPVKPVPVTTSAKPASIAVAHTLSLRSGLLIAWGLGAAFVAIYLLRIQAQLWRLKRQSRPAEEFLQEEARSIQEKLQVRRKIGVRVSDAVSSLFLTGLLSPTIIIPEKLMHDLSRDELSALLAHEIAHVQRHDLFWCIGWQWVRALLWIHPLAWKIPAAHNLACEQEADRLACGHLNGSGFYRQLLARLTLRILALPSVETRLALNASSQIANRLNHLERGGAGAWNWRHSVAAFALVCAVSLGVMRCEFSRAQSPVPTAPAKFEFKDVQVIVQDEDGKPVQGATIKVTGFRVKGGHSADAYGWRKDFGPAPTAVTDADGKASVKYPIVGMPEEKEDTGALIFHVDHPDFATVDVQTFYIDGRDNPIHLPRGVSLEVSAYSGADHRPVTEMVPNVSEIISHTEDWQKSGVRAQVWTFHKLSPGGHIVQLMGRLPSGEIGYSDAVAFTAKNGETNKLDLELKPGIRLEGKIDDQVPRPVRNGRVMVSVRPKEFPALSVIEDFYDIRQMKNYGNFSFWHTYRPIAEDGSFVVESVPPGEADVVVLGDGFASKSIGQLQNRVEGQLAAGPAMGIPQAFPLSAPVTQIQVLTESTVTLEFTAKTESGQPIEGVDIGMHPDAFRMSGVFGWSVNYSEKPFQQIPQLAPPVFSGKTDNDGRLVLSNLPAEIYGFWANHPKYQLPLQGPMHGRYVRTKFSPGETNVMNLVMQPIGTDFMGSAR